MTRGGILPIVPANVKQVVRRTVVFVAQAVVVAVHAAVAQAESSALNQARNAVVTVSVARKTNSRTCTGSGFYVSRDGKLITNWHVIRDAASVTVRNAAGRVLPATVVAEDAAYDLAVLQTDGEAGTSLELAAPEHTTPGQAVTLLTAKPVAGGRSFRQGIIAAVQRIFGKDMLQITTPLQPGCSGSPLVNPDGLVVGVANGQFLGPTDAENVNFAVPVTPVRALLAKRPDDPHAPVRVAASE